MLDYLYRVIFEAYNGIVTIEETRATRRVSYRMLHDLLQERMAYLYTRSLLSF